MRLPRPRNGSVTERSSAVMATNRLGPSCYSPPIVSMLAFLTKRTQITNGVEGPAIATVLDLEIINKVVRERDDLVSEETSG
ncbi:hypothetical protein HAX54_041728, partial [Datura stramonium]|nr:hypothetical protein [Datura stramonium]